MVKFISLYIEIIAITQYNKLNMEYLYGWSLKISVI